VRRSFNRARGWRGGTILACPDGRGDRRLWQTKRRSRTSTAESLATPRVDVRTGFSSGAAGAGPRRSPGGRRGRGARGRR
jgi:hypothetical protein